MKGIGAGKLPVYISRGVSGYSNPMPRHVRLGADRYMKPHLREQHGVVEDKRPMLKQREITQAAKDLVAEFYQRRTFIQMCENGLPREFAGKTAMGVGKTQAHTIFKEVPSSDSLNEWFQVEALTLMNRKKTPRGAETKKSSYADAFFEILAGNMCSINSLRRRVRPHGKRTIDEIELDINSIAASEVRDYAIYTPL